MSLPQELFDEILSHLPLDDEQDKRALQNYSLVAKSWTNPSRRRLFKTVEIREAILQSWLGNILPADNGLLQHVRSLSYITNIGVRRSGFQLEYRVDVLRDYFPFLHQLRHLSLSSMHLPSSISQELQMFSAFRHTLSRLSLKYCKVTISALVALINRFPSLNHLDLSHVSKVDGGPAPPLSRPLIGQLRISGFHQDILDLLDQLSGLGSVSFDDIVLTQYPWPRVQNLERIVNAVGVNVKRLRLLSRFEGCTYIT
jgi:hypothetical protein